MRLEPSECTAIVQGFGNVGSITARRFHLSGIKVIAISDHTGAWFNANGIDIEDAILYRDNNHGVLKGYMGGELITNETLLTLETTILAPCALENQITKSNASDIKAGALQISVRL